MTTPAEYRWNLQVEKNRILDQLDQMPEPAVKAALQKRVLEIGDEEAHPEKSHLLTSLTETKPRITPVNLSNKINGS